MSKAKRAFGGGMKQKVCRILDCDPEELEDMAYVGYSGRGMFGRESSFAFSCGVSPNSREGHALQALGLSSDSLGHDYIYYTRD